MKLEVSWHQKSFWNVANKRMSEDRRAMPREEEKDLIREHKAVHEEKFLSSWLRDDAESKADKVKDMNRRSKEEEAKSGNMEFKRGGGSVDMDGKSVRVAVLVVSLGTVRRVV